MTKNHKSSIPDGYGAIYHNSKGDSSSQLELFPLCNKSQKAQISSIPGTSLKDPNRYRVSMGNVVLGDRLTIDQVLKLAGGES